MKDSDEPQDRAIPRFCITDFTAWSRIPFCHRVGVTMAIIHFFPKFTKAVPSSLVAIIVMTVLAPVFSFSKLLDVEPSLGPEMKSTGESIGMEVSYPKALYKALLASGIKVPLDGRLLVTIADKDKEEAMPLIKGYHGKGFSLSATAGTAKKLKELGIPAQEVGMLGEDRGTELLSSFRLK